jgi:hypothetical protein
MIIERRKPEKGLTPWQPYRELEGMGRRFGDFFWPAVYAQTLEALPFGGDGMGTCDRCG